MTGTFIIYDGDCIFCQNYVRLVRLREAVGDVELIDARSDDPRIGEYQGLGYDLDQGMLFVWDGRVYHGSDAVHVLGNLSSSVGCFNRINSTIFANRFLATLLYPALKLGRRAALMARGKRLLADSLR